MPFPRSTEPQFWEVDTTEPELKANLDHHHIVQIRDPIMSIISEYCLTCGDFTSVDKWLQFAEIGMLFSHFGGEGGLFLMIGRKG